MKIKEFDVILCIKKKTEQEAFEVVQGDSKSNLVRISLIDGLEPYDLTGASIEIIFRKADGTTVQQTEQTGVTIINAAKGQLQCILKTNTIACPGPVSAEVRILDTETLLTSSWFDFYVRKSLINDKTIESTDEFPILTQLIADTNGLVGRVEQIEKQVPETVVQRIDDLELNKLNKDGDSSDTTATFEDYSTNIPPLPEAALGNIKTGSKLSVLFSNIKAFCKGAITIGKLANNLSTTAEGLALDARQGKVLNDSISMINSNLGNVSTKLINIGVDSQLGVPIDDILPITSGTPFYIFANWTDTTNFPERFGSGVILPCSDVAIKKIIYTTGAKLWVGNWSAATGQISWTEK